jgi:hypothetical protein
VNVFAHECRRYGTAVGSTFSSIFPGSIDRLELNSNVPPDAEAEALAVGAARGLEQALDKLLQMCVATRRTADSEDDQPAVS